MSKRSPFCAVLDHRLERVQEITVVQGTHGVVRIALDTDQVMLSVPRRSQIALSLIRAIYV